MARISTYAIDSDIALGDKVLGTDSQGIVTKNFDFNAVKSWINSSGVAGIVGQNNFVYNSSLYGSPQGTINVPGAGDTVNFSDVSYILISTAAVNSVGVVDYFTSKIGSTVTIGNLANTNKYGVFTLTAFAQDVTNPSYYKASITFTSGLGALEQDEYYGIAVGSEPLTTFTLESPNGGIYSLYMSDLGQLLTFSGVPGAPFIEALPTLSGTVNVSRTLTATAASMTGNPAPDVTWQWQRKPGAADWDNIAGQTADTYNIVFGDLGYFLRARQTATNIIGVISAASASTIQVEGNVIQLLYIDPFIQTVDYFEGNDCLLAALTALDNIEIV